MHAMDCTFCMETTTYSVFALTLLKSIKEQQINIIVHSFSRSDTGRVRLWQKLAQFDRSPSNQIVKLCLKILKDSKIMFMAIIILFNGFKTILTIVITILIHFLKHTSYCKTGNILMWTNIQMHMSSPNGGFFIHVPCFCLVVWFYFGFNVIIYTLYFLVVFLSAQ